MKQKFNKILLLLVVFLSIGLNTTAKSTLTGSLLWKISGKDLSQPSYILGTHHLIGVNYVDSIVGLRDVMNSSEQVVGELVMEDQASLLLKMEQASILPQGESYHQWYSDSEYQTIDGELKSFFGVGLDKLGVLKPAALSLLYSVTLYMKLYPESKLNSEGIDAYLQRISKEKGNGVLGLETVEDQIYAVFGVSSLDKQAKSLLCLISNSEYSTQATKLLDEYYKARDLDKIYDLAFNDPTDPCPISKAEKNALLKVRNEKWMQQLPAIMSQKSSLIVVGALHLVGDDGLLHQLRAKGYNVEPCYK